MMYIFIRRSRGNLAIDRSFFMAIINSMRGRPPKAPEDRKTAAMRIPLTAAERDSIRLAAKSDDAKPVTWARDLLIRAAKRRAKKS